MRIIPIDRSLSRQEVLKRIVRELTTSSTNNSSTNILPSSGISPHHYSPLTPRNHQNVATALSPLGYPNSTPSITSTTHVLCGAEGIGKTTLAQSIFSMPAIRRTFFDGILWIDVSTRGAMNFNQLIEIYKSILSQIEQTLTSTEDINQSTIISELEKIVYIPSSTQLADERRNVEAAMIEAQQIMRRILSSKQCLLFVDGLFSLEDLKYFQFQHTSSSSITPHEDPNMQNPSHCHLFVTTTDSSSANILDSTTATDSIVVWNLNPLNDDEALVMFQSQVGKTCMKDTHLMSHLGSSYRECHGMPMSIRAFGKMLAYHYEHGRRNKKKLSSASTTKLSSSTSSDNIMDCIRALARGENTTHRQISTLLKYTLEQITSDDTAKACFSSFAVIFTCKDECILRPWIHRKVVLRLFTETILLKQKTHPRRTKAKNKIQRMAVHILDALTQVGILTRQEGHPDDKTTGGVYHQMFSNLYQQCGEDFVKYAKTRCQLQLTFVAGYIHTLKNGGKKKRIVDRDVDMYMIRNLPSHLLEARAYDLIPSILQDVGFITQRIQYLGIEKGAKKHVQDAEKLLHAATSVDDEGSIHHQPQTLLGSYMAFSKLLEISIEKKDEISTSILQAKYRAMYFFSYSLFLAGRIGEGFYMLNKTKPFDKKSCELFLEMDSSNMRIYQNIHQLDIIGIARAQIRIGSIFVRLERGQESINLLEKGLSNLKEAVGEKTLEVARAQVYIGELYLKLSLYSSAIEKLKPSLSVLMYELGEDSEELLDALFCIGQAFFGNGDSDMALSILQGVLKRMVAESITTTEVLITMAKIFIIKNDARNAVSVLNEARNGYCNPQQLETIDLLLEEADTLEESGSMDHDDNEDMDKENEGNLYDGPHWDNHNKGQEGKQPLPQSFDSTISDFTRFTFGQE